MSVHIQLKLPSHYRVHTRVEGYIDNLHYDLRLLRTDALGQMAVHAMRVSWGHWKQISGEAFIEVAKQILHL
jgi:hypothetical protein